MNVTPELIISIAFPVLFAFFAKTLAGFLSQNHWPEGTNEAIADFFIIAFVIIDVILVTRIEAALAIVMAPFSAMITLYVWTSLQSLTRWSKLLQSHMFVFRDGRFYIFPPDNDPTKDDGGAGHDTSSPVSTPTADPTPVQRQPNPPSLSPILSLPTRVTDSSAR